MTTRPNVLVALAAGTIIMIGLPLLGWGILELGAFFANPARTGYVVVMLLLELFSVWYLPNVGRYQEKPKPGVAERKLDLYLIQLFSLAIVLVAPFTDRHAISVWDNELLRYVGLALVAAGFVFMQIAEKYLGQWFSKQVMLQEDHRLIQTGPYRFIRHPRYLGLLTFFLGIALVFRSYVGLGIVLALALVLLWRISTEEALLRQEFGPAWTAYSAKTWRIMPFVF